MKRIRRPDRGARRAPRGEREPPAGAVRRDGGGDRASQSQGQWLSGQLASLSAASAQARRVRPIYRGSPPIRPEASPMNAYAASQPRYKESACSRPRPSSSWSCSTTARSGSSSRRRRDARGRRLAGDKLQRAEAIIDELLATLDMSAGGEIAERLQAHLPLLAPHLIEARLEQDAGKIDEVAACWASCARPGPRSPTPTSGRPLAGAERAGAPPRAWLAEREPPRAAAAKALGGGDELALRRRVGRPRRRAGPPPAAPSRPSREVAPRRCSSVRAQIACAR